MELGAEEAGAQRAAADDAAHASARFAAARRPKVALVHYWLVNMRGGERVLEALCELFPDADIFTHAYDPAAIAPVITRHKVTTSFIGKLPGAVRHYQKYLPLMPMALEELDLSAYDLVISSESGPAKGVITRPDALHVCYCHSPMRYAWDHYHLYRRHAGLIRRLVMPLAMHRLRQWDVTSAARVDHFIANSSFVAQRIRKYYRREADVVFPPVDVARFAASLTPGEGYLLVGELVHYKRVDLAIAAFNAMEKPLTIVGDGEERTRLERSAGPTVTFKGRLPDAELQAAYAACRALIFPHEEDFGIVPVEAMAAGRPVIAYGRGGVRDSVIDGQTGLFFQEQTVPALIAAVEQFENETGRFDAGRIADHAAGFSRDIFKAKIVENLKGLGHPALAGLFG
jgi:glycosyltransferase involved in cell wall biosynthesis